MALDRFNSWRKEADVDVRPHQTTGFEWCSRREAEGRGGILADEMGLGKTILMLGLTVSRFMDEGTLVVVPRGLLDQWESAIWRFLGHRVVVYHGTRGSAEELLGSPLVLTTYGTVVSRKGAVTAKTWGRLICDEAHHCRNPRTRVFSAVCSIDAQVRWLVTGTPIQNDVTDIRALFYILGCLEGSVIPLIRRHVLRRTKAGVGIEIPGVQFHEDFVSWECDETGASKGIHEMVNGGGGEWMEVLGDKGVLSALLRARQMCLLPKMIQRAIREDVDRREEFCEKLGATSKINAVMDKIYTRRENGRRKIVFCHFLTEMATCIHRLEAMGLSVGVINGNVVDRAAVLDGGWDVLVVQIQTACEGLNLQDYSEIYFTSPHWNPAVEAQAVARCHRIGQEAEVDVFRFTMETIDDMDTLDMCIKKCQERKLELAAALGF